MPETIAFTVSRPPKGYTRTTQKGRFSDAYQEYQDYKTEVVAAFLDATPDRQWGHPKPITSSKENKVYVFTKIFFQNDRHPDPSNVHKAIEDALFQCDKYVAGTFDFDYDPENPRVEVILESRDA